MIPKDGERDFANVLKWKIILEDPGGPTAIT
jgi:hypothetical protein